MIDFKYPVGAEQFDAAAFTQAGELIKAGHREECELAAKAAGGLYCWWIGGRPVIKTDFDFEVERDEAPAPCCSEQE